MTEDVTTWLEVLWDGDDSSVVVGDQVVSGPGAWVGTRLETGCLDLEEVQGSLVDGCAVTRAASEVVDDWTVVGRWPGVPLELNLVTSSDGDKSLAGSRVLVAGDVVGGKCIRRNEAVVQIVGSPASNLWWWVAVHVGGVVTSVGDTVGDNTSNVTVGLDEGSKGSDSAESNE